MQHGLNFLLGGSGGKGFFIKGFPLQWVWGWQPRLVCPRILKRSRMRSKAFIWVGVAVGCCEANKSILGPVLCVLWHPVA